ncbi:MAG TPA: phasin family protein [Kiloniellales bacterium]|jgi:phasin family protein
MIVRRTKSLDLTATMPIFDKCCIAAIYAAGLSAVTDNSVGKQLEELNIMAQKQSASAGSAPKTVKAQAPVAAPLIEMASPAATPVKAAPIKTTPVKATPVKATPVKAPVRKIPAAPKAKAAAVAGSDFEALMAAGQDNLAACVTCGTIVSKGLETLGNQVMTLAQANIDANMAATKSLMTAKTPHELVDLQTSFARERFEGMAKETAKIGAMTMNVASQAMEPLRSRFDANTRTALRPFGL